jgi:hypothetical protein
LGALRIHLSENLLLIELRKLLALLLTSTLVMGWILPVATTERATSPRVTLASLLGSMDAPEASRASAMPSTSTTRAMPAPSQIQNRLFLREAATENPPKRKESRSSRLHPPAGKQTGDEKVSSGLRPCRAPRNR